MAVPEGAPGVSPNTRLVYSVVRPREGHLQDRGLGESRPAVGQEEEQACDELRQAQQVNQAVLQEGHHEEDGAVAAAGVPVLPPVQLIIALLPLQCT